ncbi:MAG: hypothetical protein VXX46_06110 [Bacteroidota bacterium]|nr:hypothetical protein [Bacteroidota bacterium]
MKRTGAIIILLILLILSAGTNTYLYYDNQDSLAEKELELVALRDSLQNELLKMEDSLNLVVSTLQNENAMLVEKVIELEGPNNPRVVAAYREINRLRRQLIQVTTGEGGDIIVGRNNSNVNLGGIRKQLKDAKIKIKDLTAQIDTLIIERDSAIVAREVAVNEREALAVENTDLKDRIQRGAIPQFGALITSSYNKKKKLVNKSKKVTEFLITFDIENNPLVTEIVEEEVTIRLIDPDGGVLSKNNKRLRDKSQVFTLKESITFDGAHQKVKWKFPPRGRGSLDGKLKKGKYTTELWTRGLLRQTNTFTLR